MNPLTDILTPTIRKYLYLAWTLATVVVGALNIADVDTGATVDVLAYLGAALGLTAASNVDTHEAGE